MVIYFNLTKQIADTHSMSSSASSSFYGTATYNVTLSANNTQHTALNIQHSWVVVERLGLLPVYAAAYSLTLHNTN